MSDRIEQVIQKIINIPGDFHRIQTKSWNTLLIESGYFELYESITEKKLQMS